MIQSLQVKKNSHRFHGYFSGAKRANLGPSWPQSLRNRQMSTVQQHGKFTSVLSLSSNAPTCTSRQFPYKNLLASWVIHTKHIWGVVLRWSYVSTSVWKGRCRGERDCRQSIKGSSPSQRLSPLPTSFPGPFPWNEVGSLPHEVSIFELPRMMWS